MEVGRQQDPKGGDVSEAEEELEGEGEEDVKEAIEIKLLRVVLGSSSRPKLEISNYDGNLKYENLLDYVSEMKKYF